MWYLHAESVHRADGYGLGRMTRVPGESSSKLAATNTETKRSLPHLLSPNCMAHCTASHMSRAQPGASSECLSGQAEYKPDVSGLTISLSSGRTVAVACYTGCIH